MSIAPLLSPYSVIGPDTGLLISLYRPYSHRASSVPSIKPVNSALRVEWATVEALFDF